MKQNSQVNIEQSPSDNRQYLGFILENGIKVIVISDVHAEKSAASLDVQVGQLQDPEEYQGLAHFCEHMLFMGTEKYPSQNEYSEFLSQNGGSDNAYTDMLNTNYYFDVKSDVFEGALDRFSQFFITPLFDASCAEKEINAIENEHQMNVSEDSCRMWYVFKSLALEGTKFRQYGGGNLITLSKPDILEELLKFYENNYSSHKMNLVLYGCESVEQLQELAIKYFSPIKNKENIELSEEKKKQIEQELVHPYPNKQLSKIVKIIPIKDEDTIEFTWVVEDQRKNQHIKPDDYLSHIFGHEGQNSLLSHLIDEGLAVELTSYAENCQNLFTLIGFNITLTQRGFIEYKRVCHAVFTYIEILKKEVADFDAYAEVKEIESINFRFLEKTPVSDYVTKIADDLHQLPMSQVLKTRFDFERFDKDIIQNLINQLTIDTLIIYLCSKTFDSQFSKSFNTSQQDFDLIIDSNAVLQNKINQIQEFQDTICHNHSITHPHVKYNIQFNIQQRVYISILLCLQIYFDTLLKTINQKFNLITFKNIAFQKQGSAAAQKVKNDKQQKKDHKNQQDTNLIETTDCHEEHGNETPKLKSPLQIMKKYKKMQPKKTYTIEEEFEDEADENSIFNVIHRELENFKLDHDEKIIEQTNSQEDIQENNSKSQTSNSDQDSSFVAEKFLGAKFFVSEIPDDIKQLCNKKYEPLNSKKKLGLPVKNKFIPKSFDILPLKEENKYPQKIYDSEMSELYYKQDDTFKICKTLCDLFIFTNDCDQSKTPKSFVLQEIWIMLFENYINETIYLASMAHIDLRFEQHYTFFKVRIKGYSDKIGVLFEEFLSLFQKFNPGDEGERIFRIFYEKLMSEYDNYYRDAPHSIITDFCKNCLLSTGKFTIKQKIMALKEIKLQDLIEFNKTWLSHTRLESLIMGNITKDEAISWIQKAEQTMKHLRDDFAILNKQDIPLIKPNKIMQNTTNRLEFLINEKEYNPDETNSCLLSHYQRGPETPKSRVIMKLIQNYLSEPLFDQLRTNEKLGYVVWCWDETFRGIQGFTFVIQSSVCSPMHVQNRIDEFLKRIKEDMKNLTQERFDNMKHTILIKLTEKPKTLHREFTLMQEEILLHKFLFDRKERVPIILDSITIEEFTKEFDKIFFEDRRKVEIHIVCKDHKEEQQMLENERIKTEQMLMLQDDTHLRYFSLINESLYHDYSSPIQIQISD